MKLKVFYAADGDCLLLTSSDGHHLLVDGGRSASFQSATWPVLEDMATAKKSIDLVVVSHIDADHITGILWLLKAVAAWTVYDYQTKKGGNPSFPEPAIPRPPKIKKLWHNAWLDQVGDLAGPIEALVNRVDDLMTNVVPDTLSAQVLESEAVDALQGLAESIPDGVALRRLVDDDTPIPRNEPFRDLVLLRKPPHVEKLGKTRLTVIGPAKKHLEALRDEWRKWLEENGGAGQDVDQAAEIIVASGAKSVTPPNRASITLLAEETVQRKTRSCLLTGDAAEDEILEGLSAAGRIVDGRFWCNVIKVQHHGSEFNLSQNFAGTVLGDHYVFCADGAHHNPEPDVVKTIVETRLAADPRPFTLWFNCSPERTIASRRKALRAGISEATTAADKHPEITVNVLDDAEPYFDIEI